MEIIRARQIYKIYSRGRNEVGAVNGVSLSVQQGEMLAVIGRSGSGKSTLMNILGCIDVPTEGSLELFGSDVAKLGGRRLAELRNLRIGFVFQGCNLISSLTALENVELPLYYRGVPAKQRRRAAASALERVGLADRAAHYPSELSGGQQQRTAIARAVAADPELILADEPTGNLDRAGGASVMDMLTELNAIGKTVIIITHDEKLAARCPRVIGISDGSVVFDRKTGEEEVV